MGKLHSNNALIFANEEQMYPQRGRYGKVLVNIDHSVMFTLQGCVLHMSYMTFAPFSKPTRAMLSLQVQDLIDLFDWLDHDKGQMDDSMKGMDSKAFCTNLLNVFC